MDHLDVFHQSPRRSPSALYLNGSSVPVIGVLQFIHIHQIEIASDGLQVTIRMLQQFVYHPVHSRRDLMFITHIRFFLFHIVFLFTGSCRTAMPGQGSTCRPDRIRRQKIVLFLCRR